MMVDANENSTFFASVRAIAKFFATVILITLPGMISTVSAATWHVSIDGSDSHGGTTWADAFATIQKGIDTASNGDTVWVADGTYSAPRLGICRGAYPWNARKCLAIRCGIA